MNTGDRVPQERAAFHPNPQQKAVFSFAANSQGNLNLVALAGTGKTTTLVQLVPYLEGDVYFGAFGKDIAATIRTKVADLDILGLKDRVTVKTVHQTGLSCWSKACRGFHTKINRNKIDTILDEIDQEEPKAGWGENRRFLSRALHFAKQGGFGVLTRLKDLDNWYEMIEHFSLEQEIKSDKKVDDLIPMALRLFVISIQCCKHEVDFNDMLLAPLYYECRFPTYDWVLIDEAQDISPLRLGILCKLIRRKTRVIAVGDPNQAIFGFTGAASESMEEIRDRFDSVELPLSVTYRCPKVVVEEARQYVPALEAHPSAPNGTVITAYLKEPPKVEGEIPPSLFWDLGPYTNRDAILCRNTRPLVELAYQFLRKQIPAMVEGRDIGTGLLNLAGRWKLTTLDELEIRLAEWGPKEIAKYQGMNQAGKAALIEDQVETLNVLIMATRESGGSMISDLTRLVYQMFGDTPEGERPKCVILSTIHKAKGREWPRVFILGMNRYMPSPWARKAWEIQQEKNLAYVALTRAMDTLVKVVVPEK